MERLRASDKTVWGRITNSLFRIRTEMILIAICISLTYFLPKEAIHGLVALFITKTLFVSIGVLVAHSIRKAFFPYIDMQKMLDEHHWGGIAFLCVWYGVIIWAFAVGG